MRNIFKVLLGVAVFVFLSSLIRPPEAFALEAETCRSGNSPIGPLFSVSGGPAVPASDGTPVVYDKAPYNAQLTFSGLSTVPGTQYRFECIADGDVRASVGPVTPNNGSYIWNTDDVSNCWTKNYDFNTFEDSTVDAYIRVTTINSSGVSSPCSTYAYQIRPVSDGVRCSFNLVKVSGTELQGCFQPGDNIEWSANVTYPNGTRYNRAIYWHVTNIAGGGLAVDNEMSAEQMVASEGIIHDTGSVVSAGQNLNIKVYENLPGLLNVTTVKQICDYTSTAPVQAVCSEEQRNETPPPQGTGAAGEITTFSLCRQIPVLTQADISRQMTGVPASKQQAVGQELQARAAKQILEKAKCCQCAFGSAAVDSTTGSCQTELSQGARLPANFKPGLYTSLGCIPADSESIVTTLVRIGLGIAGGVALLMILAGAFMFSTSQGEPKKAGEAKELITSAVLGLIFIIFSVTLLQFIGVTVLHIPGFGTP